MDLKVLLLRAINSKRTLQGCRRMCFGKHCYAITYEVQGKYLTVTSVKRRKVARHENTFRQRMLKQYRKIYKKLLHSPPPHRNIGNNASSNKLSTQPRSTWKTCETEPPVLHPLPKNKEVHTITQPLPPKTYCHHATTMTDRVLLQTTAQQTITGISKIPTIVAAIHRSRPMKLVNKSSQTDFSTEVKSVLCQWDSSTKTTQTDATLTTSSSTQMVILSNNSQNQTEGLDAFPDTVIERDVVVYMLNEIGEMVLNQNHMLSNNSKLLGQISEMTLLTKIATIGKTSGYKAIQRMKRRNLMNVTKPSHFRVRHLSPTNMVDQSLKSTQTDFRLDLVDKSTQTDFELLKPKKKLSLFKKDCT